MNLAVLQENLKAALATVMPAVATKSQPILETVRLDAQDNALTLTATNLETTIVARCAAKIEASGARCVPAKLLAELVAGLPNDRVMIEHIAQQVRFRCAQVEATLDTLDAEEFPTTPTLRTTADLPITFVRSLATLVAPLAATDTVRPALCGVALRLDTIAEASAADGHRLARLSQELEGATIPPLDALIPAKMLIAAAKALKGIESEYIRIGVSGSATDAFGSASACVLDAGGVQIVTRLIDATYPNAAAAIPTSSTTRVILDTRELRQALAIAAVYAARSSGVVKLQIDPAPTDLSPGRVTLSANAASVGASTITLDAMVVGPATQIALNVGLLADGAGCMSTPQMAIELQTAARPAVLRPVGRDDYFQVIMPMSIRS